MKAQLLLTALCLATTAPAQLRINEVLVDPAGPNAGNQIIEIKNTSNAAFTPPAGWTFCIRPFYPPIPQIQIPAGGVVRVHMYAFGANTATDWFIPPPFGVTELPLNGEFQIYSTNLFFLSPAFIEDFVSWGAGVGNPLLSRIDVATAAGIWPNTTTHIALPDEGSTLARFDTGTGPSSFYVDSTPTLGQPNQPAAVSTFGVGCPAGPAIPLMDVTGGQLPWLGEPYTVKISNLPLDGIPVGVMGFSNQFAAPGVPLPFDLGVIGFPGCLQFISAEFITPPLNNVGGSVDWDILLPANLPAAVIGKTFHTQGAVLFNTNQVAVSNAASHVIGGVR